jgi:hypothetical protein
VRSGEQGGGDAQIIFVFCVMFYHILSSFGKNSSDKQVRFISGNSITVWVHFKWSHPGALGVFRRRSLRGI